MSTKYLRFTRLAIGIILALNFVSAVSLPKREIDADTALLSVRELKKPSNDVIGDGQPILERGAEETRPSREIEEEGSSVDEVAATLLMPWLREIEDEGSNVDFFLAPGNGAMRWLREIEDEGTSVDNAAAPAGFSWLREV